MNPLTFHHIANEHSTLGLHFISNHLFRPKQMGESQKTSKNTLIRMQMCIRSASDVHPFRNVHPIFANIIRGAKWSNMLAACSPLEKYWISGFSHGVSQGGHPTTLW